MEVVPAFVDSLEETAATDFDIPEPAGVLAAEPAAAQTAGNEVAVPWFDADEEAVAQPDFVAERPVVEAEEPLPEPESRQRSGAG